MQSASDLRSQKGVDYTRLHDLLAAKNWKDADDETKLVMLKAVDRDRQYNWRWIAEPGPACTDLRTIDRLWVKYSSGRFGFSVQKKIYLEVGGILDGKFNEEAWEKFGDRVGWRVMGSMISYKQVTFDTSALLGHLPAYGVIGWFNGSSGPFVFDWGRGIPKNCSTR